VKRASIAAVSLLLLAACSGSRSATGNNASTVPASAASVASTATITSFVVPASVQCGSATSTVVPVGYAVSGSARRELDVDGLAGPALTKSSGLVRAPVHCDDLEHTVVLVAVDARGARTTRTKTFATVTGSR